MIYRSGSRTAGKNPQFHCGKDHIGLNVGLVATPICVKADYLYWPNGGGRLTKTAKCSTCGQPFPPNYEVPVETRSTNA